MFLLVMYFQNEEDVLLHDSADKKLDQKDPGCQLVLHNSTLSAQNGAHQLKAKSDRRGAPNKSFPFDIS